MENTPAPAAIDLHPDAESTFVESIIDFTPRLDLKVSSRAAMVGSLNDNSTETFWESSDEDRNKSKWVLATLSKNNPGSDRAKIRSISVHIDNGRDIGNKVSHLTFKQGRQISNQGAQGSNNPNAQANNTDMVILKQVDVESRFAGKPILQCTV